MLIDSLTYTVGGTIVKTIAGSELTDGSTVLTGSTKTVKFEYAPANYGSNDMTVTLHAEINGVSKVYNDILKLTAADPKTVTRVLIDGTHLNDYVNGYYSGNMLLHYRMTLYDAGFTFAAAALLLSLSFAPGQPRVHFVLQGMILGVLTVLYLSQFLYSRIFQTLYIVQSLKGAGKAMSFASVLLDKMKVNAGWIFLFLVPLILFFTCQRILLKKITYSVKLPLLSLAAAVVAC